MSGLPARLGDYLLGEQLGAGGMGAVHHARHAVTGAEYAVKLVQPGQDPVLALRFQREGRALAALDHPNVVRVHSTGFEHGYLYLVQELIAGADLAARLRLGPLPPEEARALVLALGRGLAHAHAQDILHRDLKPANVLLGDDGRPRLIDFGLARTREHSSLTETGALLGSPAWFSPEQAEGKPTDARSDVYGLGAILYHCLTGRPPAGGGSVLAVMNQVLNVQPPRPRSLNGSIPPGLEAVCLRALRKRPEQRFPTVEAMLEALETDDAAPSRLRLPLLAVAALLLLLLGAAVARRAGDPDPATPSTPTQSAAPDPPRGPGGAAGPWAGSSRDDPELWKAARAGVAAACVRLGLLCVEDRPEEAARFLKRAGPPLAEWRHQRDRIVKLARRAAPPVRLQVAWFLLLPPGQEFPTPTSARTRDPTDRRLAKVLIDSVPSHLPAPLGHLRMRIETWLRLADAEPPRGRTATDHGSMLVLAAKFPQLLFHLRLEALSTLPPVERRKTQLGLANLCWLLYPARSLALHQALAADPRSEPPIRETALRSIALMQVQARTQYPDLWSPALLRSAALAGAQEFSEPHCTAALLEHLRRSAGAPPLAALETAERALESILRRTDLTPAQLAAQRTAWLDLIDLRLSHEAGARRQTAKLLRRVARRLARSGTRVELGRLLRLWARLDDPSGVLLEQSRAAAARATEREQLLPLLESTGLSKEVTFGPPRLDPGLWAEARRGEAIACRLLGLDLLETEPVEAARWLRRGGPQVWSRHRDQLRRAIRDDRLDMPSALHLAQTLLRPIGAEYPTRRRPLTSAPGDREWATSLLQRVARSRGGGRALARRLLSELKQPGGGVSHRVADPRDLKAHTRSGLIERVQKEEALARAVKAGDPARVHAARLALARSSHQTFPEVALDQYLILVREVEALPLLSARRQISDMAIRFLAAARPDRARPKELRRLAIEGLRFGGRRAREAVEAILNAPTDPSRSEVAAIRRNLTEVLRAPDLVLRVRARRAFLLAQVSLREPRDPKGARAALRSVAREVHGLSDRSQPFQRLVSLWLRTLPASQRRPWGRSLRRDPSRANYTRAARELGILD